MKTIKGDLILTDNTTFNESIKVKGSIIGDYNLKVEGDIECEDIKCRDIECLDIKCLNIYCRDINCRDIKCKEIKCWDIKCDNIDCDNIECWNIDCWDIDCENIDCLNIILCDKIKVKNKCIAKILIKNRFNFKRKEQLK